MKFNLYLAQKKTLIAIAGVGLWILVLLPTFALAQAAGQLGKPKSGDDELFDNLESDLFDGLDLPPVGPGQSANEAGSDSKLPEKKPATLPGTEQPETPEFQPLPGEDIGQPPENAPNPLLEVTDAMKKVENRFRQQDTTTETQQLQKEILSKLDELIAAAEQQKKKPSPASNSSQSDNNNEQKQDEKQGDSQSGASSGQGGPARESSDNRDPVTGGDVELGGQNVLMKRIWGQLPPKIREEILTQSVEEFLPEYRNLIEDYYKRLAKESSTGP